MELIYARWLAYGTGGGLLLLASAFLAYVTGVMEPLVPLERLAELWALPLHRYVAESGAPTGWGWVAFVGKGDYASLAATAVLGFVTLGCYLRLLISLLRRGERALAFIAALQVAVLVVAASGLVPGAG